MSERSRFNYRFSTELLDRMRGLAGDRPMQTCMTRAMEQWCAREEELQGLGPPSGPQGSAARAADDGESVAPLSRRAPEPAEQHHDQEDQQPAEPARRQKPVSSREWGRG